MGYVNYFILSEEYRNFNRNSTHMKNYILSFLIVAAFTLSGQTAKIDKTLLSSKNWVQADNTPNGLDTPQNANQSNYKSNKLAFYKMGKWGSLLNGKNEFVVGDWKIKDAQLILYDLYSEGRGFTCEIIELTKDTLIISYVDLYKTPRTIRLIPT